MVSTKNQGAAAARNRAFELSKGDTSNGWTQTISWRRTRSSVSLRHLRTLLASECFSLRHGPILAIGLDRARFIPTSLWRDLSPVEWLVRKMGENLHMQTATWLTSRELSEAAGPGTPGS